ncbi:hypothetical protein CDL15_Pgr004385 [Punica granatum]|uniref:Response regulatory domain-containing protein n=1 Tax=Punica granatum TaxID=22663 RepID=A0A218XGA3_PUNGR|nr:hypothetical protein CDL15_Pgr004385 [Punica granatum]
MEMLRACGHSVTQSDKTMSAAKHLMDEASYLVICTIHVIDGFAFLETSLPRFKVAFIMVVSTDDSANDVCWALQLRAEVVLRKQLQK